MDYRKQQPTAADLSCATRIACLKFSGEHQWRDDIAVEVARHTAEQTAELRAINAELLAACKAALDPDPCQLDHHGYCQAHGLGDPCEQKLLRSAIARAEAAHYRSISHR